MDRNDSGLSERAAGIFNPISPPPHEFSSASNCIKYMNPNFVERSDTPSQEEYDFRRNGIDSLHNTSQHEDSAEEEETELEDADAILDSVVNRMKKNDWRNATCDNGVMQKPPEERIDCTMISKIDLLEMGYNQSYTPGWEELEFSPKEDLSVLQIAAFTMQAKPDMCVRIDDFTFHCHSLLLQCYSGYFGKLQKEKRVELPSREVSPYAFFAIYEWMIMNQETFMFHKMVEIFNAATYLEIRELMNKIWYCFGNEQWFLEDIAFDVFMDARPFNLLEVRTLAQSRVNRFFLIMVASNKFFEMTADEICGFLSSNTIGVNTELEVMMTVVRWLDFDWDVREAEHVRLARCVRFCLMPPCYLLSLKTPLKCSKLERFLTDPEVAKYVDSGIAYTTTKGCYGHNEEQFATFLQRVQLQEPRQRRWVYDKNCKYHKLKCTEDGGKFEKFPTYKEFDNYMMFLYQRGKDYWRQIELRPP